MVLLITYEVSDYVHVAFAVVLSIKDNLICHGDRSKQQLLEVIEKVQLLVLAKEVPQVREAILAE